MNTITWIGGALLPPTIVTGILGMNTLGDLSFNNGVISILIVVLSAIIIPIYLKFFNKDKNEH
jgi:Mg2+ and Co2+ transporter CorA